MGWLFGPSVDELATLPDVIKAMASATGLDADQTVIYPKSEEEVWMQLLRERLFRVFSSVRSVMISVRWAVTG